MGWGAELSTFVDTIRFDIRMENSRWMHTLKVKIFLILSDLYFVCAQNVYASECFYHTMPFPPKNKTDVEYWGWKQAFKYKATFNCAGHSSHWSLVYWKTFSTLSSHSFAFKTTDSNSLLYLWSCTSFHGAHVNSTSHTVKTFSKWRGKLNSISGVWGWRKKLTNVMNDVLARQVATW